MSGVPEAKTDNIPQIEVTPEMIAAGQQCLEGLLDGAIDPTSDAGSGLMCIPSDWAKRVYLAMWKARAAVVP